MASILNINKHNDTMQLASFYYNLTQKHYTLAHPKVPATKVHSQTTVHDYPKVIQLG